MSETPEKTITLGRALLGNIVLPFVGAYLYYTGTPLKILFTSLGITIVVMNAYFLIAFKVWGSKSD